PDYMAAASEYAPGHDRVHQHVVPLVAAVYIDQVKQPPAFSKFVEGRQGAHLHLLTPGAIVAQIKVKSLLDATETLAVHRVASMFLASFKGVDAGHATVGKEFEKEDRRAALP